MKLAVYGTGGVGGFFGGKLASSGAEVWFIARGSHLQALQAGGLRVTSVHGDFVVDPVTATDDPVQAGPCDYVLVAVKSYHTDQVAPACLRSCTTTPQWSLCRTGWTTRRSWQRPLAKSG